MLGTRRLTPGGPIQPARPRAHWVVVNGPFRKGQLKYTNIEVGAVGGRGTEGETDPAAQLMFSIPGQKSTDPAALM